MRTKRSHSPLQGIWVLALLSTLVFLCGCGGSSHLNLKNTGVRGVATTTNNTPFAGAVITIRQDVGGFDGTATSIEPILTQTTSDAQGAYSFSLAPGGYIVNGDTTQPTSYHIATSVTVQVVANTYTRVDIQFTK